MEELALHTKASEYAVDKMFKNQAKNEDVRAAAGAAKAGLQSLLCRSQKSRCLSVTRWRP